MTTRALAVERAIGAALGCDVRIEHRSPLGGGSINRTERIDTTAGTFVLKTHEDAPRGFFRAEADGLAALSASGTTLTVPRVIAFSDTPPAFLAIQYLPAGARVADFDERLGRGIAELHRSHETRFGFASNNYCGLTPQLNAGEDSWIEFYGRHRLGAQLAHAVRAGRLDAREARALESIITRLDVWLSEPPDGPSLIHGDLWSGNLITDGRGYPALIDPAAYYAHPEAELGMMTLFGGFSRRVFDAYLEAFPLEPEWRERLPLYELYHLLNHLNLFGGGYRAGVAAILSRFT